MDLTEVSQEGVDPFFCMILLSWGLVSDVDVESEACRCCGAVRFVCWTLWRLMCLRRYPGKVSYKLQDGGGEWVSIEDDFALVAGVGVPWVSHDMYLAPKAILDDGCLDLMMVKGGMGRCALLNTFMGLETGTHLPEEGAVGEYQYMKVTALRVEGSAGIIAADGEVLAAGAGAPEHAKKAATARFDITKAVQCTVHRARAKVFAPAPSASPASEGSPLLPVSNAPSSFPSTGASA